MSHRHIMVIVIIMIIMPQFECLDRVSHRFQGVINCPASLEFTEIMGKRFCAASIIDLVVAASYIGTGNSSVTICRNVLLMYQPICQNADTRRHTETQSCTPDIICLLLDHRYQMVSGILEYIGDVRELSHLLASSLGRFETI